MNRFKTYFGYSVDRINYADAPKKDDQFVIDSAPSLNLIKIDEWSAPAKACPENGSLDTKNELLRMSAEINQMDDDDQEDIVEKYDTFFENLSKKRDQEIALGEEHSVTTGAKLKETLLISEQLKWLYNLSEKLIASVKKYM